ncbi:HNH endonuclease signature motif containing protein [Micromonospora tarensis]|uniref:HNH endonuclease n=1 Tax=Micromonospora tarensis TaxID=2806100 RepID=A0ABS1YCH9_9ACTN|nr:HNH endonuclease signature motif containing protein [Micromonospora tarensis]MBM0275108.1 HNH endonuclease [Micromonospora tarensis]
MTQAIRDHYDHAQQLIADGTWRVDPHAGLVHGVKGAPFRRTNSWGYVQIKFRAPEDWQTEHTVLAHRVIWEAEHGPLADGLTVNHLNGVKTDNRLANLEAVTQSDNMRHAYRTGLHQPVRSNARLTEQQVRDIYRRCRTGERDADLAAEYGMKRSAINNIRNGWSWRHVTLHQPTGR